MATLWAFEELINVEQLGHKLLLTSLELERFKAEANEKSRKNKKLIHLLKFAIIERDEAKDQLQKLLSIKAMSLTMIPEKACPAIPHFLGNSPLVKQGNVNSSNRIKKSFGNTQLPLTWQFSKQGRFFRRFVSGPLPRWQNPPQLQQIDIPTLSIKGHDTDIFAHRPIEC